MDRRGYDGCETCELIFFTFCMAIAVWILTGCTAINGHKRVDGWPELTVREHRVPHAQMRDRCSRYAPWWGSAEACAEMNLATGTCDIWFSADFPPQSFIVEHERLHCQGYDHIGSTVLRDYLHRYRGQR